MWCDQETDGGGWTVIQRRQHSPTVSFRRQPSSTVSFRRTWNEYARGFGDVAGSFWLGNEVLHALTHTPNVTYQVSQSNLFCFSFFFISTAPKRFVLTENFSEDPALPDVKVRLFTSPDVGISCRFRDKSVRSSFPFSRGFSSLSQPLRAMDLNLVSTNIYKIVTQGRSKLTYFESRIMSPNEQKFMSFSYVSTWKIGAEPQHTPLTQHSEYKTNTAVTGYT